jgi:hypothetical protein
VALTARRRLDAGRRLGEEGIAGDIYLLNNNAD